MLLSQRPSRDPHTTPNLGAKNLKRKKGNNTGLLFFLTKSVLKINSGHWRVYEFYNFGENFT